MTRPGARASLAAAFLMASSLEARDLWISAPIPKAGAGALAPARITRSKWYTPTPLPRPPFAVIAWGESGVVELASAERFPGPSKAVEPTLIDRTYLRIGRGRPLPLTGAVAGEAVTRLDATYAGVGLATLGVQLRATLVNHEAGAFAARLVELGAEAAIKEREEKRESKKPAKEAGTEGAKTFAAVSDGKPLEDAEWAEIARTPLGLPLELVPDAHPLRLLAGGTLKVILLEGGRPLSGVRVRVAQSPASQGPSAATLGPIAVTDADGAAVVKLDREGPLLLSATTIRRITKADKKRDEATKNADWISASTSLRLDVLTPPKAEPKPTGSPVPARKKPRAGAKKQ